MGPAAAVGHSRTYQLAGANATTSVAPATATSVIVAAGTRRWVIRRGGRTSSLSTSWGTRITTASANQIVFLTANKPLTSVTRRVIRSVMVKRWPNRARRPTVTNASRKNTRVSGAGVVGPHSSMNVLRVELTSIVR